MKVHKMNPVAKVIVGGIMTLGGCALDIACELGAFTNGHEHPSPLDYPDVVTEQPIPDGFFA